MNQLTVKTENTGLMLEPTNTHEALELADRLAKSQLIPKNFQGRPNDVFVAMLWSRNLGMPIVQGLQNIAVINGRPSIWGDAALAIVKASGLLESFKETLAGMGDSMTATCTIVRKNEVEPYIASFSVYDAKLAGLWGKQGPWKQYPKRMLALRARGFALRNAFPDLLLGIGMAEEEMDITPAQTEKAINKAADTPKRPQRKSEAKTAVVEDAQEVPAAEKLPEPNMPKKAEQAESAMQQAEDLFGEDIADDADEIDALYKKALVDLDRCTSYQEMVELYTSLDIRVKPMVKDTFSTRRSALGV